MYEPLLSLRAKTAIMSLKPAVSPEAHLQRPSISRADSPLLGFTLQENVSPDPLHRPSPSYVRRLPDALLDNKDKVRRSTRIYALYSRDASHIAIFGSISTRTCSIKGHRTGNAKPTTAEPEPLLRSFSVPTCASTSTLPSCDSYFCST